jgi:hypothetical protein
VSINQDEIMARINAEYGRLKAAKYGQDYADSKVQSDTVKALVKVVAELLAATK